ncbi:histone chaperone domain CHZ-domain-containing protein [Tuber borchii]|uniref:Histone chaperone domain CHZ-domain-containing protein n=1 Tax=Tuber borchii TaxID=42251 RepID=A0A2T6ZFR2_TUBBO|nr:histone chaperone domain CHZ-domain-containing protein [Tuber borchii]
MSDITSPSGPATENPADKGKGKAIAPEEEESDSGEDMDQTEAEEDDPDVEDDDLAALDTSNIIAGSRTRGKQIDFAKAAAEQPADEEDDDDDEYHAPTEETAQHGPGDDGMDIDR